MSETIEVTETETPIAEFRPVEAGLSTLRDKFAGTVFDVHTAQGLKDARSARRELVGLRGDIETRRKELKAPVIAQGKLIDSEAKRIAAAIGELEEPIVAQIKEQDALIAAEKERKRKAEEERVEQIQARIQALRSIPLDNYNAKSDQLRARIKELANHDIADGEFSEFDDEARAAKGTAIAQLRDLLEKAETAEHERAEQAERQQELDRQAEEQRKELEATTKRQAAEQERLDAERASNDAQAKRITEERERVAADLEANRIAETDRAYTNAHSLASLVLKCAEKGPTAKQWIEIRHSASMAVKLGLANKGNDQ